MLQFIHSLWRDFSFCIFPDFCVVCEKALVTNELYLCTYCSYRLPRTNFHNDEENPLFKHFSYILPLEKAFAYLHYSTEGMAQRLVHALKYDNKPELAAYLGMKYANESIQKFNHDIILPVPIHPSKRKTRGYNQAEYFARGLAEVTGIEVEPDLLVKTTPTKSQTKKGKVERLINVDQSFDLVSGVSFSGCRVLLVDDVITTGATVSTICDLLIKSDVAGISICAIATGIK